MWEEYKNHWEVPDMATAMTKIVTTSEENETDSINTARVILKDIPAAEIALDIGAGVGRLMRRMTNKFGRVYGVDMSASMVNFSKEYLKDFPNCTVVQGDGLTYPFASGTFDFVYSYITFQHMPLLRIVRSNIAEIYRVLKPNGICRVQTTSGPPCYGFQGDHGYYFIPNEFENEFKNVGFSTQLETGLLHPSTIWVTGTKERS